MIINLFTKTFLIDDSSLKNSTNEIQFHDGKDFIEYNIYRDQSYHPSDALYDTFLKIKSNYDSSSFYFINDSKDNILKYWLPLYFYTLDIYPEKELMDIIYNHSYKFNSVLFGYLGIYNQKDKIEDNDLHIIQDIVSGYKMNYEDKEITNEDLLRAIPAEYFINMIDDNSIAYEKYNNFRIFDIIEALRKVRYYIFNSGLDDTKEEVFRILDNCKKIYDDMIKQYPLLEDMIKKLFKKYNFDDYIPLLTKDMNEYLELNTKMGYSSFSVFKYNKDLANYIKSTGYTIPTEIGRK